MKKINLVIQKSGRLNKESISLLEKAGIKFDNFKDQLKVDCQNFPLNIYFLRNSDIPRYLSDGVVDIAIIGQNLIQESELNIDEIMNLNFSRCRVSIAIPLNMKYSGLKDLNNLKIATSYPNTLKKFLSNNNLNCEIHKINGSVEISPNIGLSDAVCDIVSTGNTLYKNNLKEVLTIFDSQAVLCNSNNFDLTKKEILDKLIFRINSVLRAKQSKYILMNVPNDKIKTVSSLLPVLKSPTVLPLEMEGWSSLHTVIDDDKFWESIDSIKEAGAEDILVCPIEKMVL
ncbi:MAG: ATP phosphoribosyltransferase [Flavobacteriaceae bacterium]|nr:ATP phosphoribosyltransferase [Flavobacteriaceae bacterium]